MIQQPKYLATVTVVKKCRDLSTGLSAINSQYGAWITQRKGGVYQDGALTLHCRVEFTKEEYLEVTRYRALLEKAGVVPTKAALRKLCKSRGYSTPLAVELLWNVDISRLKPTTDGTMELL